MIDTRKRMGGENRSRREFFSLIGTLAFIFVSSTYFIPKPEIIEDEDEYIIINGWLLKKGDLNDI